MHARQHLFTLVITSKLQSTVIKFSGQVAKLLGDVIANFSATLQSGCPETRNEVEGITTRRARTRGGVALGGQLSTGKTCQDMPSLALIGC
jgi:hypothetical protein